MRAKRLSLYLYAGILIGAVGVGCGAAQESPDAQVLREATVTLVPGHCMGVVVEDGLHVMTAAHCVDAGQVNIPIELSDGERLTGTQMLVDEGQDIAVYRLDTVARVPALEIAPELPRPGEGLLFASRSDLASEPQEVWLERLGRCPSLPGVPQALFTTLRGVKGDSGSPVVDLDMRVVGLVHGGAACSIAAPTAAFAPVVRQLAEEAQSTEMARKEPARVR
ncbi:S1 family peptidase [Hyalangium rubrum]|uniref:Serine protease n=1 Tax=Hyalangium rubrum TaxID=3103134 RepID=A0ABU5GUZ2_9BACT|nr:serine protease [Hyalangium sp. s54d21]MDY7224989.1 serine protease [Hyalangium sp. s54d21]